MGSAQIRLPFVSYDEVYATIQYDSNLKALLYGKMMYIKTAVKNIALESILVNANSESIQNCMIRLLVDTTTHQQLQLQNKKGKCSRIN